MTMIALTKLSNCAASTRKTTRIAKPKVTRSPLDVSPSVAVSASGTMRAPGGSSGSASACASA